MKLPHITQRKWNYLALAFLLPFVGLLLLRLVNTITFNGTYSMLYSDQYHQYYPFFLEFRRVLRSGGSLLYSWNVGLGMDYLGLISYYLASPLNLLSVLIPESLTLAYFSLLMLLKLGLAGLFFAIFLKKTFHKDDFSICVFGSFYALCAWALGYQWNIMWLDTFALLPLVVLGTVSLLRDKKFVLYTVSLFLSVCANYYIGFFTCIFIFLLFFCYEICRWKGFARFFSDLLRIAAFSILAIGMTAILELPTLAALQTTQSSVNKFPEGFKLNITDDDSWRGLLDAMRQVAGNMNGGLEPTFKEGLPNLYCGIFTNILAFLFLTCRQIKLRDKLCSVFLLLFFNVSFIIRQLDYVWHGFHFTNMIPYRFSFLYSFVMLYMAYRAWTLRRSFRIWQIAAAGLMALSIVLCGNDISGFLDLVSGNIAFLAWNNASNIFANIQTIAQNCVYVIYNGVLLALYVIVLVHAHTWKSNPENMDAEQKQALLNDVRSRRQVGSTMLLGIMVMELALNLVNFGAWFPGTNVANYPKGKEDTANAIEYMQEREADNLFYRAETTHSQTLNDAALNNYRGVSTFTSSANVKVTTFMQTLGYGAKNTYNRYCFEESSPVGNLFLGLKYMLERDGKVEENPYFDDLYAFGDVHLLENNAYLPLGFLANSQLVNVDFDITTQRFSFQNELMEAATGITTDVWYPLTGHDLIITGSDTEVSSQVNSGYCTYSTESGTKGTVTYSYTAGREGLLCINLDLSKKNSYTVWLNGKELYSETYSLPQMLSVSQVVPGDVVEIKLNCKADEKGTISISAAILNEEVFRKCCEILAASVLNLTTFEDTLVEGTIDCNRDGVLYTSIPQNGNWTAYVDGKEAQIILIGDAMCGLLLTEGSHTITFRYENFAFSLGWKVSLVCLVIFLIAYVAAYHPNIKRKKGKYQN